RIDKPVSGIVLFARTSKALSRLQKSVREKDCSKRYLATVEGIPKNKEAILEHYLVHDSHFSRVSGSQEKEAKFARLRYKVLGSRNGKSLLEINLETGRYHQIRVQLAEIGLPIVGDTKYGSGVVACRGIALHHSRLEIPHPIHKNIQLIEAKVPKGLFLDLSTDPKTPE
ncbi:MAG: 23S rRNA pseudouridine1911/1915/1917 synthase, partial [Chlamydiales bacterium]